MKWQVKRQDDNGNIFLVKDNMTEEDAEELVIELTERGHKQMYWKEEIIGL